MKEVSIKQERNESTRKNSLENLVTDSKKKSSKEGYSELPTDIVPFRISPIELDMRVIKNQSRYDRELRCKVYKAVIVMVLILFLMGVFMYLTKDKQTLNLIKHSQIDGKSLPHLDNDKDYFERENKTAANKSQIKGIGNKVLFDLKQKELTEEALNKLKTKQLRRPEKIKYVKNLSVSLNIEHDSYLHLKIKDKNNKRWEVPEYDILSKNYLKDLNHYNSHNLRSLGRKNFVLEDGNFSLEIDGGDDESFGFKLNSGPASILSFSTKENFLFSDNYIHFEYILTSGDIYGFGERSHEFKLGKGIYTTWPHDIGGLKYDDGRGRLNGYSHQPIGLHKTRYKNVMV